jgi:TfoX/Sxy family transcriptional regulator of competence genes
LTPAFLQRNKRIRALAYDTELEARIDLLSLNWPGFAKKSMFGGKGYLLQGNMAFGIWHDRLIVRCGAERYAALLGHAHVRAFDVTGKAMTGWLTVLPEAFETDAELVAWLERGRDYAASLEPK